MADPKRIEQLVTKLDQLTKATIFISGFNKVNSIDMSDSEIANFETQIKLMEETAIILNEISFEIHSATREGRLILNTAKYIKNWPKGDEDDE